VIFLRVVLVCDFEIGLLNRILAVYEHFSKRPEVILIKRRRTIGSKIKVHRKIEIPLKVDINPFVSPIEMLGALFRAGVYLFYVLSLLHVIVRNRPVHLVHAHYLLPQGLAGVLISRATKAPLILTAAGTDINVIAKRRLARLLMRNVLFRGSKRVIAVSQGLLTKLRDLGCKDAIYIPNCVKLRAVDMIGESVDRHHILFVGSLTRLKRPDILVQAFHKVADQFQEARLTIVGIGPMQQPLKKLVCELSLTRKVCFAGYLREEELIQLYRRSSVFVLPSSMEGLSLSLLEAMSFGKRIIVSDSANSGVIQHEVDGLIFRHDDVDDLARKLLWMLENPEKSMRLSINAKTKCEQQYSLEVVAPRLERLYAEVLSQPTQIE